MHGCCCHTMQDKVGVSTTFCHIPRPHTTRLWETAYIQTPCQGAHRRMHLDPHTSIACGACACWRSPIHHQPAQWPRYNFGKHKDSQAIWSSVLRTARVCSAMLCNTKTPSVTCAHDINSLYLHVQVATICFNWTLFLVKYHNILEWWLLEVLVRVVEHSSVTVNQ